MLNPSEEAIDKFVYNIESLRELFNTKSIKDDLSTLTSSDILTILS